MKQNILTIIMVIASLLLLAGCSEKAITFSEPRLIESPAIDGGQTPNLTVGLDGKLYLSWIEPADMGHALRFATWAGDSWSAPATIAEGDDWFVNWADFPSMAALADGTLASHWLAMSADADYAYDVLISLSRDGGNSWSEPLRPHSDGTPTEHGFVSLVPSTEGHFEVIWLDGRHTAATPRGAMTLRYATLQPDGTLEDEVQLDNHVCDCCSTDAVLTGEGQTLVAYRDRTTTEIRDISVARLDGSTWAPLRIVNTDNWNIAACPVNGPALAADGKQVAIAWFTAAQGEATVNVAFSQNGGRTFDDPIQVDHGDPIGRVDIVLLEDGTAVVSWLEREDGKAQISLRRVTRSGAREFIQLATTSSTRSSGFPRMVRIGNRLILAWTETGDPTRIATAELSL